MAEGGPSAPKEEEFVYPKWNWDRESLEYVFASDFIHFVIELEDKSWRSHGLITHRSPLTPFNTAIQRVVEKVLRKDSIYLGLVFDKITKHYDKLNQVRFNMTAVFLKLTYFGTFDCFGKLLKYFCVISYFSAWALKKDLHTAPFFCVDIIIGYIREFLVEHNFTSMESFWYFFEREADEALRLPYIWTLNDEELKCLPHMQNLVEVPSEEIPSGEKDCSKTVQVDEPEVDILSKYEKAEDSGKKVSAEKEQSEDSIVESVVKESAGPSVESQTEKFQEFKGTSNVKQDETSEFLKESTVLKKKSQSTPYSSKVGKNEPKASTKTSSLKDSSKDSQQKQKASKR